jgi:hypothetical protein
MVLHAWIAVAPVGVKGWGGPAEFVHLQVGAAAAWGLRRCVHKGRCRDNVLDQKRLL